MKKLMLGCCALRGVCAIGTLVFAAAAAVADEIKINKVETTSPWVGDKGTVKVEYSLGGLMAKRYKVVFDITADGRSASVTNDTAELESKTYTKEIDTAGLFGGEVTDTKAKVEITLIMVLAKAVGVQLWPGGPFWAEFNVDTESPEEYGPHYPARDAKNAAESMGAGWRLPTEGELNALLGCSRSWVTQGNTKGCRFTGKDTCSNNSIFLPAAGYKRYDFDPNEEGGQDPIGVGDCGYYWSGTTSKCSYLTFTSYLRFDQNDAGISSDDGKCDMSVRAVRDAKDGTGSEGTGTEEWVVATVKAEFWLGPGCKSCPWTVGEGVTAYVENRGLYLEGAGEVEEFEDDAPWAPYDDELDGIGPLSRAIKVPVSVMATLPISVASDDMVLVSKESIQAAKATTVRIVNGQVELGVSVLSNADITAKTENWAPVKFSQDTAIGLSSDGTRLILPIPVATQQGFMVLQSGDAKEVE